MQYNQISFGCAGGHAVGRASGSTGSAGGHANFSSTSEACNHFITKHCKLNYWTRKKLRKKVGTLKRVAIQGKNFKEKKRVVTRHGEGLLKLLPPIVSALDSIFK